MRLPLLLLLLALAACAPAGDPPAGLDVIHDDLDRVVALPEEVRRAIPLAPNLTEIVYAAGAFDRLVAVSPADDYPAAVDTLPRVATHPLDLESLLSIQPDLLLANAAINRAEDAARLAQLNIPTYFFDFARLADVPRALRTVGELLASRAQAEAAASQFEQRLEAVRRGSQDIDPRPRTLLLIGDRTLYAFGGASYTQELIEAAGGESITAVFPGEGVTLSEEFVLDAQPQIIIGTWGEDYDVSALLAYHPSWRALPAVRDGHVYSMDPDLVVRPGPRLADGAEELAGLIRRAAATARASGAQ